MTDTLEATKPSRTVLIVDDDSSVVSFLSDRCSQMRFAVQTASNGLQALIMARQNPPDVLIADVNMPELDGLSVCFRLLGSPSGIDVILITGNPNQETIERCESFGATYVRKGPQFWDLIRSALIELFPEKALLFGPLRKSTFRGRLDDRPVVLVIDDDPEVSLFFESRLQKFGVDSEFAPDGTAGYRTALRIKPNVIVSDYYMPNGDVNYLMGKLRSTPATENIPVIIMSGRLLDDRTKTNLRKDVYGHSGAAGFFTKSFELDPLFSILRKYCVSQNEPVQADSGSAAG